MEQNIVFFDEICKLEYWKIFENEKMKKRSIKNYSVLTD